MPAIGLVAGMVAVLGVGGWLLTASNSAPQASQSIPAAAPTTSTTPTLPSTVDPLPSVLVEPPATKRLPPAVPVGDVVAAAEADRPKGRFQVAVLDIQNGQLAEGGDSGRPFIAASLSKLIVVVDMYDRQREEGRTIDEADLGLVQRALTRSDDGAMNALWGKYDGPGAITRVAHRIGLTTIRTPADSSQWGNTSVTAADYVQIYGYILRQMPAEDRDKIVGALAAAEPVAADGFDQNFGLMAQGASAEHYAKQGWVPYSPGGYLLHSAGVVHDSRSDNDYAIAMLSIQPYTSAEAARGQLSRAAVAAMTTLGAF